jgi:valyl-tRNA synthetase
MPFLTEELWQNLKKQAKWMKGDSIMVAAYPHADETLIDTAAEAEIDALIEIVRAIRNVRAEYKVETGRWIDARIHTDASRQDAVSRYSLAIKTLARANPVTFIAGEPAEKASANTLVLTLTPATVVIPMASMVDLGAEKKKIAKDLEQTGAEVQRLEARLSDEAFLAKAPAAVIEKERQKLYTLKDKLDKLKQQSSRF